MLTGRYMVAEKWEGLLHRLGNLNRRDIKEATGIKAKDVTVSKMTYTCYVAAVVYMYINTASRLTVVYAHFVKIRLDLVDQEGSNGHVWSENAPDWEVPNPSSWLVGSGCIMLQTNTKHLQRRSMYFYCTSYTIYSVAPAEAPKSPPMNTQWSTIVFYFSVYTLQWSVWKHTMLLA